MHTDHRTFGRHDRGRRRARPSSTPACAPASICPHACGHGLCGTCKAQVLDGDIDHGDASAFALMDFERERGHVAGLHGDRCMSDVTIEADIDEDPDARRISVRDFVGTVVGSTI